MQICTALFPRTVSPSGENVAWPRCGRRRCGKSLEGARKPPRAGHCCRRGRGLGLGWPSPRATGIAEPPLPIWANGAQPSPPALIADEPRARWPAGLPVAGARAARSGGRVGVRLLLVADVVAQVMKQQYRTPTRVGADATAGSGEMQSPP